MRPMILKGVFVLLSLVFHLNCSSKISSQFSKQEILPPGTLVLQFSKKVKGPIDLNIDGVRIKVDQSGKGGDTLIITGLEPTVHRFTIASPNDAFGPSSSDVVLPDDQGIVVPVFSQSFEAILYGNYSTPAPADNPSNIKATLRKR